MKKIILNLMAAGAAEGFGESLFDGAPTGALQLDIPSQPGGVASAPQSPAGAAPLPPKRKGGKADKAVRKTSQPKKPIGRPLLLGGLLILLVGLILGQTGYGYFGLNLLGGGSGVGGASRRASAANPPGQNGQSTGCTLSAWSELRSEVTSAAPSTKAVHFASRRNVSPVCRRVSLPVRLRS